jgi:hypothetical protein
VTLRNLSLTVINGPEAGRVVTVAEGAPCRIGASAAADACLQGDASMSPVHAAVRWADGLPLVRSLQSAFGTWLNGVGLQEAPLRDGDELCLGGTYLRVRYEHDAPAKVPRPSDPREAALATLRETTGVLYAVLDAARDDRVRELMRLSSYKRTCLYDGWGEAVFGEAAPWLVKLWKTGRLVEQLIHEGMGKAWGVFLTSRAPFVSVRRQCRRLLQMNLEGEGRVLFRWYDPGVMLSVHPHMSRAQLHNDVIDSWIVESREGERLVTLT